ncbi:MAG: hypothetical protein IPI48_12005 [bacterium]|nr:hypothetical protein [bacterium]
MRRQLPCLFPCLLLVMVATAGCDTRRHDYVVHYQESAHASVEVEGRQLFLTARAAFADASPAATARAARDEGGMTADERTRYVREHPEIYGPVNSRQEYEEQFGDEATVAGAEAVARGGESSVDVVMSGSSDAVLTVVPTAVTVVKGGQAWSALDRDTQRLTVGARERGSDLHEEGVPVRLHFPVLPAVAPVRERLTEWQITRRPAPSPESIEMTMVLELDGRPREVTFRFDRVAEHPQFPPNPLYWLYAAH